ncbi:MAG: RdgB/HAM1 family non-canonical purine NTP pyrophosphatase [Ruminococcus sp.]|jgi:XTP/dITP diphosphohydrolase|uniref:RdgB/HAM1 family non-canonical purine NTP pyrophosphatase n=1 Tax=unclassified Ruminococcus TaxID=2608920 RepID=UPI002931D56B|nr:RdgB/HAM1 family non-canonical purine NTP pyrophosphatase [uncultured Ruminococcus sp.]MBQ1353646.1 RdgB/HAM1 family non-canonical purine NTP pyrophosphatase [Ruminococcus sp.]MBQ1830567.1 RdgB/HAM1 family non-canonical purine NTP pyrophosphatase [Ruminococcus sp.]MBQ1921100.1 RdgB/HAM1 family non-canonical purine NTP pyrophosphatase [Ruminococcus sp.]MBQ2280141.1 RdgB/HAM1 family non-canonical purine NTP pyrophosphatase [Ruminococcus sp.]MBQ2428527.1 RdgB/HAM1 family non-canonical purine N
MKFIIATNNKKKLVEMERILKPLGIEAVSAKDAGVVLDEVDETGTTFGENAFLKANAAYIKTGMPAVADDSGICVDALGGRPGIFSARYSPEDCVTDEDRTAKILEELQGVPDEKRGAHYTCAICCILPDGSKIEIEETCEGKIGYEFIGDGGFGYDPIFYFGDKTFAQISGEDKDKVSHRGKALRKLQAALREHFG